jgi:predicted DNA-binding transcriptional regulator AlpA
MKAGAITATDYDELMAAITHTGASEAAKEQALITRKAGAKILGISMRSFDRLLKDGTFHPIRVGKRSIRISYAEIENFCNQYL